jgi:hypothetical protein
MPIPSNNYKPFLAYLSHADYARLKKFAAKNKTTMAHIVREAVSMRVTGGNSYVKGFNDGVEQSIKAIAETQYSQMRFPSGKSFAELVADDLVTKMMKEEKDEVGESKEPVSGV